MDWKKSIPWVGVAVTAFLLGYIPQRREAGRLRADITASTATIKGLEEKTGSLQIKVRLAELRDLTSSMYFETSRRNYGIAQQRSTQFFTAAADLAAESADPVLKSRLQSLVAERDAVTASLAKADASSQDATLKLLERIHENVAGK